MRSVSSFSLVFLAAVVAACGSSSKTSTTTRSPTTATPLTRPVTDGRRHDILPFPPASVGVPLTFQAVVHTRLGSIALDWPVKVRP